MRGYLPISRDALSAFSERNLLSATRIFVPSEKLASEYGVSDLEEAEYGALEIAREAAEESGYEFIIAFELTTHLVSANTEGIPGVLDGTFQLATSDVVAYYLITGADDELEWYDATEVALCLAKVAR